MKRGGPISEASLRKWAAVDNRYELPLLPAAVVLSVLAIAGSEAAGFSQTAVLGASQWVRLTGLAALVVYLLLPTIDTRKTGLLVLLG